MMTSGSSREERGSMTVVAAGLIGVMVLVLLAGLALTSTALAAHRARAAADLAALSAAIRVQQGAGPLDACSAAASIASRNAATLSGCTVSDAGVATTQTRCLVHLTLPGLGRVATAKARAGPVSDAALRRAGAALPAGAARDR